MSTNLLIRAAEAGEGYHVRRFGEVLLSANPETDDFRKSDKVVSMEINMQVEDSRVARLLAYCMRILLMHDLEIFTASEPKIHISDRFARRHSETRSTERVEKRFQIRL